MSFSKRSDTAPVCYTKPLDSLKHWNDSLFFVDAFVFPLSIPWHTKKTLVRDPPPTAVEFSVEACDLLATHQAPFRKFPKPFLCLVGQSRYYKFDDDVYPSFLTDAGGEMDLFAFIRHADLTKGGQDDNIEVVEPHLDEDSGDAAVADKTEESDVVPDKPKKMRKKRKAASGDGGSNLPPKKLREDHDTSADAGASTAGKSLAALQGLLEQSTLAVEIGVTAVATVPFVTSSMTFTPEREGGGHTDYVFGPNLRTHHLAERFVISTNSSQHSSTNDANAEITYIVRSSIPPPPIMTAVVAATAVADISSASVLGPGTEPAIQSIFADFASPSTAGPDTAGPSIPRGIELSANTFYVSQEMDSETLHQIYVPKWNVINDSTLDDPEVCRSMVDQLTPTGHVFVAEAAKAARVGELNSLKERNSVLEEEKGVLDGKLSFDELSMKASSIESQRDGLIDQVSLLETAYSVLRDQVSGYELFKEQIKAVQDEQVKVLSDRVAELDSDLIGMDVHLARSLMMATWGSKSENNCFMNLTILGRRLVGSGFQLQPNRKNSRRHREYIGSLLKTGTAL
ncbi:hypothetical protein Tco_1106270 [Tanacetum coccineum]